MTHWESFNDEDLLRLWRGIDTAYWYPNAVLLSLAHEVLRRNQDLSSRPFFDRLVNDPVRSPEHALARSLEGVVCAT